MCTCMCAYLNQRIWKLAPVLSSEIGPFYITPDEECSIQSLCVCVGGGGGGGEGEEQCVKHDIYTHALITLTPKTPMTRNGRISKRCHLWL